MQIVFTKRQEMLVNSIKIGIVVGAFAVTTFSITKPESKETLEVRIPDSIDQGAPPSLQMYKYIKAYADTFDIPLNYAFGIAYAETRYEGPFHWKYNHAQTSPTGAEGPMQILLSTARYLNKDLVSRERLRTDIEYNVKTSMGYLRRLYNRYKNWPIVFGYYNTGYPRVNDYAIKVTNHKLNW
jgi:soluble lytic murein transglycosylase-like protein